MVDFNCANVSLCKTVPEKSKLKLMNHLVTVVDRAPERTQSQAGGSGGSSKPHLEASWSSGENRDFGIRLVGFLTRFTTASTVIRQDPYPLRSLSFSIKWGVTVLLEGTNQDAGYNALSAAGHNLREQDSPCHF